jgi:hypothetical protein
MGQEPAFQPRMELGRLRERRSSAGPLSSGAAAAAAVASATVKGQPVAKCMLTLDGYSYVIGMIIILFYIIYLNYLKSFNSVKFYFVILLQIIRIKDVVQKKYFLSAK